MTGVDSNILVLAHRQDATRHEAARECVRGLSEGSVPWAIPWPVIHEFLSVVTNPGIFRPPTPPAAAVAQVAYWLESPTLVLLSEGEGHWGRLSGLLAGGRALGPKVHDARIAALCLENGVTEFLSDDRDFRLFPALRVRNPLA